MDEETIPYKTIEKALIFLDENTTGMISLREAAEHVDVSEYHFRRMFIQWAGTNPDRFSRYVQKEYLKHLLELSADFLLETGFSGGLSNSGGLHGLFVSCGAMTPGELRNSGSDVEVRYGIHPTPYGSSFIAFMERGIFDLRFLEDSFSVKESEARVLSELRKGLPEARFSPAPHESGELIERIFFSPDRSGEISRPLRLLLLGTNFQIQVWETLLRIPEGAVASYDTVARAVGKPNGGRAVGNAVGCNRIAYIIPCHRVIQKAGTTGKYKWGIYRKRAIIGREISGKLTDDERTAVTYGRP